MLIRCGALVKKGDTIGRLHDLDRIDDEGWPVLSGVSGVVVGQAWAARVQRGQHIACVGKVLE
ncbi:MAG TPA: hypothetical protein VMP01_09600 [Pirellulaceae bacterium]|nr:hypothetical protein [Pirellulaceae bacterium]